MKEKLKVLVSILLGNALLAFSVCAFVVPNDFMLGGATMLNIETGYAAEEQKAVFCVTHAKKHPAVRDAALRVDPKAFIVTADVKNVNGRGYTLSRTPDSL